MCRACVEGQTTIMLLHNSLLGWWSIPSIFYGWRALYLNWRAVWMAPPNPGAWGAVNAAQFAQSLRQEQDSAFAAVSEDVLAGSPLRFLTNTQQGLVLGAAGLYELLGVSKTSSVDDLHAAFRARCKELHPDLQSASTSATEDMIRLNNAWEILRSERMRAAYDWLEGHRAGVSS
jgi:hypothetical protein